MGYRTRDSFSARLHAIKAEALTKKTPSDSFSGPNADAENGHPVNTAVTLDAHKVSTNCGDCPKHSTDDVEIVGTQAEDTTSTTTDDAAGLIRRIAYLETKVKEILLNQPADVKGADVDVLEAVDPEMAATLLRADDSLTNESVV